jgi:predicted lipoprotein with Yx(FWY)xxD motif
MKKRRISMKRKLMFFTLIVLALIVSACGSATPAATTSGTTSGTATAVVPVTGGGTGTPSGPASIDVSQTASLGSFLVDGKGMTLYLYTKDTPNTSNCYNSCAAAWPPLLTNGSPTAGSNVNASLLGTTTRNDGSTQVTYNGWPLYYFANDKAPGDTNGEGVLNVWYVVTPEGSQK